MPRIIVTTDVVASERSDASSVLLDEHVHSVHLSTEHAAAQLVERLAWAIGDAERAERAQRTRGGESKRPEQRTRHARGAARTLRSVPRSRDRSAVGA
jgi:hypothetical protein